MPKIPMGSKAGAAPDQRAVAYLHNVPRMRYYGSDGTAEALINFGRSVEDTGGKISGAIGKTVSAREQFYLHQRNLDDQLAATGARNLYRGINSEVEVRMAREPGSYSEFGKWAQEADKRYGEEVRAYTDKMSPDFRKQFELEMQGLRADTVHRRRLFGIHGETTAKKDVFRSQWKDAALRGDLGECRRQQEYAVKEKLIAPEENGRLTLEYNRLSAYGEVKRALDAGTPGLAAILKERNDDGGYKNHTGLAESDRDRFIRAAEAGDAKREVEAINSFNASLVAGENKTTQAELDAMRSDKTISDAAYLSMSSSLKAFQNEKIRVEQQRKTAEVKERDRINSVNESRFKREVQKYEFSSDPAKNLMEKKAFFDILNKKFPGQYKFQFDMNNYIEERSKQTGWRNKIFSTPEGEICKSWLDSQLKKTAPEKFYKYDPWGPEKEMSEEFAERRHLELADFMASQLQSGHGAAETIRKADELRQMLNDGEIYHLYVNGQIGVPKRGKPGPGSGERAAVRTLKRLGILEDWYGKPGGNEIAERRKDKNGRELLKLKNGKIVYADEYE